MMIAEFFKKIKPKGSGQVMSENTEVKAETYEPQDDLRAELEALRAELSEAREALAAAEKRMSAPPAPTGGGEDGFLTPDEVRRMSPAEVREKMPAIRASMMKWK